jgi:hypothetical protein
MFRLRAVSFTLTTIAAGSLLLVLPCSLFLGITPKVVAQAQTQLVPLVTDQTPLALSNLFGVAGGGVVNQAGDYAFFGNGASAMFYRGAGAGVPVRVMQMGDEVPGFPGSRADLMQLLRLNNSGLLAFHVDFFQANGVGQGIIFTFDGTSLQRIVAGNDPAPGGGGANFERGITLAGLNDSGDVAFTAPLVPTGSVLPAQTTLYIAPAGGAPVRVAGLGDAAPGTGGTFGTLSVISFNNRGEELASANIVGGSGGSGLFVGDITGVRKVVANGDANPFGGTFPSPGPVPALNNAGQVAFQASGALWIDTPATGISRVVNTGDAAPPPLGGTFNTLNAGNLQAFDDAGDIASLAVVSGSAVSNLGLFRFRPSNPVEVVAYRNQAAAGAAGESFNSFTGISINDTGVISFRATLVGGSVLNGIFQQTGSNPPVNIALDGQATTLSGGGSYSFANTTVTETLDNNSVYVGSEIPGGAANYAEFLLSGGAPTILMNTADALPAGARVSLRTFRVGAAGDSVGFMAQHTGGRSSLAVHNITSQATTVLTTDGDAAPGTGGGLLRLTTVNTVFLNAGGTVVFSARIIGGSVPSNTGIFLGTPGSGLTKVVANGDVAPGTGGRTFSGSALNVVTPSPINDAGQVVFSTTLLPAVPGPGIRAVFVWSPGTGASKVAAVGDVTSSGGTITNLAPVIPNSFAPINSLWINSSGQVAFLATTAGGPAGVLGIYVGTPGGTPVKVVAVGDSGPAGSTFSGFALPGFNDSGEVAFMATLTGGPGGGVFIGSTSGPPVPLALDGVAAPAGGNFSITTANPDVLINNQHDVVFRANLTGGTADSGYFVRRGPLGALQAPVLQGQLAPGTSGVFDTILASINNLVSEDFQLGPDGDLAFQNFFVASGQRGFGTWHLKMDNTIEEILVRGTVAPEFGGGIAVISGSSTAWNSGGRFAVWARVSEGTFTDGILLFVPTCPLALSPITQFFTTAGGAGSINVIATGSCGWTVFVKADWITLTSSDTGTGNDVVTYEVRENFTGSPRQTSINVSGLAQLVVQDAGLGDDCSYSINPQFQAFAANGGSGTINVIAEERCAWQAVSSAGWITITSTNVGVGNGTVAYRVEANPSATGRADSVIVAGRTFSVKQKSN